MQLTLHPADRSPLQGTAQYSLSLQDGGVQLSFALGAMTELESLTFDILVAYLRAHGYPEESFHFEYKVGPYRADLVILDPATK